MSKKRSPSPAPTITLDTLPQKEMTRSSSEESVRVIHHAVIFPNSPYAGRVSYIRSYESDAELVTRQLAAIALQPLTFAEELAAKRKQLEMKAEKRKRDKAQQAENAKNGKSVPDITIAPPSGKSNISSVTKKVPVSKPTPSATKEKTITNGKSSASTGTTSTSSITPPLNNQLNRVGAGAEIAKQRSITLKQNNKLDAFGKIGE